MIKFFNEKNSVINKILCLYSQRKFLTLHVGMKGLITKVFAALLVGWYLMGIIGFGVHTCSGSGKSFVVAFYEEMTCEEIHPEHGRMHDCCAHHHDTQSEPADHGDCHFCDGVSFSAKDCCSNDYRALDLAGAIFQDDSRSSDEQSLHHTSCFCAMTCDAVIHTPLNKIIKYIHEPDSGHELLCDRQAVL